MLHANGCKVRSIIYHFHICMTPSMPQFCSLPVNHFDATKKKIGYSSFWMTSSRKWTQRIVSNWAHFHKKVTLLKCASAMILDLKPKEYRTSTKHEKYATLMVDLQEQPCVDCWKMWFAKEIIYRSDNCKGKDKLYVATKKFLVECSELVVLIESSNSKGKDGLERPRRLLSECLKESFF